jgi:hypothetical protein
MHNLRRHFGAEGGQPTDLVLVAFDYDRCRAKFFRTNEESRAGTQLNAGTQMNRVGTTTLAEAVHASTNAPVNYFDTPATIEYRSTMLRAWDGAVAGYNNPILAGITEALANEVDRESIQVLSIGTGSRFLPMPGEVEAQYDWLFERRPRQALFRDLAKLATSIIENPPDVATYVAYLMLGAKIPAKSVPFDDPSRGQGPIVRLNPMIQPTVNPLTQRFDIPGAGVAPKRVFEARDFRRLIRLDMDAVRDAEVDLIVRFGEAWLKDAVNNQPILAIADTLQCELGHRLYSGGRWQAEEIGLAPRRPETSAFATHAQSEREDAEAQA